jgi:NAD(P)H-nitrite reductase large subunit/rubredoxin
MKKWRCRICGYIHEGDSPPETCPVCAAPAEDFVPMEDIFSRPRKSNSSKNFIIVGAGAAGIEAAKTIRSHNETAKILLFSEEPYNFYSRIHLSTFIADNTEIENLTIHPKSWYADQHIEFKPGIRIMEVQPKNYMIRDHQNKEYEYDRLIITTGATPLLPPLKGIEKQGIYSLRNLDDALMIRKALPDKKSVAVVGGGILGIEAASGFNRLGKETHIIEIMPYLMSHQLDKAGAQVLEEILIQRGLKIHCPQKVVEFAGDGRVEAVVLASGEKIPTDTAIISTGVLPNISWLKASDIRTNRGIIVNEYMETNFKDIYAAGDVAEFQDQFYGIWPAAVDQGIIAGLNAVGIKTEYTGTTPLHILKVAGLEMTSVGQKKPILPEDREIIHRYEKPLSYARLIHDNTILKGSITLGIPGIGFRLERLIKNKVSLTPYLSELKQGNWDVLKKKK